MSSESQRRASYRYDKEHTITITLKLNRKTDADIIDWLSRKKNKQGAIKDLIRVMIDLENRMVP